MKNKFILFAIVALILNINSEAQSNKKMLAKEEKLVWYTNALKADSVSKVTNKPIFAFFTGSDWCGWCHKLQRHVFAKEKFIAWAKKNVVLLELDFPRSKQLPIEIQQQNSGLQQALRVQGYPTIWVIKIEKDPIKNSVALNTFGSLGYPSNAIAGKEEDAFLESANSILKNNSSK